MSLGIHFPILLCQKKIDNISSGEPFPVTAETLHRVASNVRERVNARFAERGGHFQRLYNIVFLFSDLNFFCGK
jgi:hypothetical protein